MNICERCGEVEHQNCEGGVLLLDGRRDGRIEGCPGMVRHLRGARLNAFLPAQSAPRFGSIGIVDAPIAGWVADGMRRNLILAGPYETGKTAAAHAIMREARRSGKAARLIGVVELLDAIRSTFDAGGDEITQDEIIEHLASLDLLGLDDIGGKKNQTDWADERLLRIIDECYKREVVFVATTNLTAREMRSGGDCVSAAVRRILDGALIVPMLEPRGAKPEVAQIGNK